MNFKNIIKTHRFDVFAYSFFVLTPIAFIWSYRFLPLQDYPDWLFQGHLFSQAIKGQALAHYQFWQLPIPNSISTVFIGLFSLVFHPETSGKIFLTLCVLFFASSSYSLINSLTQKKHSPLAYIPFIFILNAPFFHGNINYLFGLSMLFYGIGYLLRRREALFRINYLAMASLSALLFFSHGIVSLAWFMFLGVFAVYCGKKISWTKYIASQVPFIITWLIYAGYHFSHGYRITYLTTSPLGGALKTFILARPFWFLSYFSILRTFYPFSTQEVGPVKMAMLLLINYSSCLLILGICFLWLKSFLKKQSAFMPLQITAIAFLGILLLFPVNFPSIIFPAQRFLYPTVWLMLTALAPHYAIPQKNRMGRWLKIIIMTFFMVQIVHIACNVVPISKHMEAMHQRLQQHGLPNEVAIINESVFDYEGLHQSKRFSKYLWQSHSPLNRLPYYLALETKTHMPIFASALFFDTKGCDLLTVSDLGDLTHCPQYIIIIGPSTGNTFIANLLSRRYTTVLDDADYLIMRKK
ncbi:hypothetical protein ACFL38_04930 [Candidatus Omnitrophota bacterium]